MAEQSGPPPRLCHCRCGRRRLSKLPFSFPLPIASASYRSAGDASHPFPFQNDLRFSEPSALNAVKAAHMPRRSGPAYPTIKTDPLGHQAVVPRTWISKHCRRRPGASPVSSRGVCVKKGPTHVSAISLNSSSRIQLSRGPVRWMAGSALISRRCTWKGMPPSPSGLYVTRKSAPNNSNAFGRVCGSRQNPPRLPTRKCYLKVNS